MNKERVDYLHQQYILNQMSSSEFEEWKSIVTDPSSEEVVKMMMDDHWLSLQAEQLLHLSATKSDHIFKGMVNTSAQTKKVYWKWMVSAAAVILVVGSVMLFNSTDDRIYIQPGKNTATLTLGNGTSIALSDAKTGLVIDASKLIYDDGTSVLADKAAVTVNDETTILTINTPRGGTYEVVLRDGTHVWLNADSKLEFPSKFVGQNRVVKLSGEGYFEVAKNKDVPFRVLSKDQEIEVLGTHFNVYAYDNEKVIKTTLLEGSVKVSGKSMEKLLTPGFQAENDGDRIFITKTDVKSSVAWKNKQFLFEREDIQAIMKKVERWYDVDVVYTGKISGETFSGGVSRFDNLAEVLKSLESTGNVSFKVKDRTVYVSM